MRQEELIIYRNFENGKILSDMVWLMDSYRSGDNRMRPLFLKVWTDCSRWRQPMASQGIYGIVI